MSSFKSFTPHSSSLALGPPAKSFTLWLPRVVRLIPHHPIMAQSVFSAPLAASHDFSVSFLGFTSPRRVWLCPPCDIHPQGAERSKEMLSALCSLCWARLSLSAPLYINRWDILIKTIWVELCWIPTICQHPSCPGMPQMGHNTYDVTPQVPHAKE